MKNDIVIGQTKEGKRFALPADVVTSTLVVYGGKGMGKTNFGSVLAEELTGVGLRWATIDPLGVWWGLRYSADGKGKGIECLILGGAHGDLPIEPQGAAVVADLVVDESSVNVVVDISRKPSGEMWSIGEKVRFVTEYAYRLFQRQGELVEGRRREPIFQILDEAARYIPQIIPAGSRDLPECLAAWNQLVEEGRNIGIGVGLLTQRSARMNKSVSEVADAMISFRIVGPNSIAAVTDWLGEHVPKERIRAMVEQIRSLPRGQALVVSPGWLQFENVVQVRLRATFDSSATPRPGERPRKVSGAGARPDLAKYAERMRETVERAKENDPRELKRRIAELQRTLEREQKHEKRPEPRRIDREQAERFQHQLKAAVEKAIKMRDTEWLRAVREFQITIEENAGEIGRKLHAAISPPFNVPKQASLHVSIESVSPAGTEGAATELRELTTKGQTRTAASPVAAPHEVPTRTFAAQPSKSSSDDGNGPLPRGEKAILRVAAHYPDGASKEQLTVMTGYKRSSRDAYIQRLREKGLVREQDGQVVATSGGIAALGGDYEPLPEGHALQEYWLTRLPKGEREVFKLLLQAQGETVRRESVDEATGYKRSSRDAYLQRLISRRLVEVAGSGEVRASPLLFE